MDWKHDTTDSAYTLIQGDCRCRVWRMLGAWQAIISVRGEATTGYNFPTAEAACAWCEQQIVEKART